jgi:TrmH RNA methyltransferase
MNKKPINNQIKKPNNNSIKNSNDEQRIYGESAVLAVFKNRPKDIIQFFYTKNKTKDNPNLIRDITTYLAKNKKSYHMVTSDEIAKLTKATHHEDISLLVKKKKELSLDEYLRNSQDTNSLLIMLDDVSNPHNIGASLRTAAHFNVKGIIVVDKKPAETASSIRVSEGGFEFVHIFQEENQTECLKKLKANKYQIVTTSSHSKKDVSEIKWNKKAVIVFGEEANGISKELMNAGDCINIKGTDQVESLNVSVAASILMYDFFTKTK